MSQLSDTAITLFNSNYNCAQSVLTPFADMLDTDVHVLEKIACGFGGGMGRLQRTCGAVTGAFMVISLYTANTTSDYDDCSETVRTRIQEFHQRFIARHGNSDCRTLLEYDVNTAEGLKKIKEENLKENICVPCVENAVHILEKILTP